MVQIFGLSISHKQYGHLHFNYTRSCHSIPKTVYVMPAGIAFSTCGRCGGGGAATCADRFRFHFTAKETRAPTKRSDHNTASAQMFATIVGPDITLRPRLTPALISQPLCVRFAYRIHAAARIHQLIAHAHIASVRGVASVANRKLH